MAFINGLHFNNIRGDIFGGLTAAVVALPLALAFGVSSGAGPIAGLYGAIIVGFFAAIFGGTPSQISGPTGPMTVVMAVIVTEYTSMFPDDPAYGLALAFTVVIMGGLMQILMGMARIGEYINYVPQPVISGFMSGIGVIIILLQIGPLLGQASLGSPLAAAMALPDAVANLVPVAAAFGFATLVIMFFMPRAISQIIPTPLFALLAITLAVFLIDPGPGVSVLGNIPTGLPAVQMPTLTVGLLPGMLKSAAILALLGTIDSLLTSLVADNITRTHHKSDRELIGQGIGNAISGLFGGLPGAGATMRTVVNVRAGGRTPLSGALHAVVLLAIVLGLGPLASHIPYVVLAGILIKVGIEIIDWDYLRRVRSAPKAGVLMMLTVLFVTVFIDLITAVTIGMIMASFLFMKRMTDLQIGGITATVHPDEETPLSAVEKGLMEQAGERILLFHMTGPMSFSSAKYIVRRHAGITSYELMLLDLTDVPIIDYTTARALEDMIIDARHDGRDVFLVGPCKAVSKMLESQKVIRHFGAGHIYAQREEALRHALIVLESSSVEHAQA
jgi:SulP family sulfate permease